MDAAYFAAYFDMTPTQTYDLADGKDGMAKAVNGTVIGEASISLGGYPGLDVTITLKSDGTDFIGRARFYKFERRIYIVQVVVPRVAAAGSADKISKFCDAFQVTKTPY